jgi:hypothetical protein
VKLDRFVNFWAPKSESSDAVGNVYFARLDCVFKLDGNGVLSRVAGTVRGYSGDGGLAISAQLNSRAGLAVDTAGNLYTARPFACYMLPDGP